MSIVLWEAGGLNNKISGITTRKVKAVCSKVQDADGGN